MYFGTWPQLGSIISLISNGNIRYEGRLHAVNLRAGTIELYNVRSFGTEGRFTKFPMAPQNKIYKFVLFCTIDIKQWWIVKFVPPYPHYPRAMPIPLPYEHYKMPRLAIPNMHSPVMPPMNFVGYGARSGVGMVGCRAAGPLAYTGYPGPFGLGNYQQQGPSPKYQHQPFVPGKQRKPFEKKQTQEKHQSKVPQQVGEKNLPVEPQQSNLPQQAGEKEQPVEPQQSKVPKQAGEKEQPLEPQQSKVPIQVGEKKQPVEPQQSKEHKKPNGQQEPRSQPKQKLNLLASCATKINNADYINSRAKDFFWSVPMINRGAANSISTAIPRGLATNFSWCNNQPGNLNMNEIYEEEFDFEVANSVFEEIRTELTKRNNPMSEMKPATMTYNKKRSFFDNFSSSAAITGPKISNREYLLNKETFGTVNFGRTAGAYYNSNMAYSSGGYYPNYGNGNKFRFLNGNSNGSIRIYNNAETVANAYTRGAAARNYANFKAFPQAKNVIPQ